MKKYCIQDFYISIGQSNLEKVKECLEQGIQPYIRDNYPIQLASSTANLEVVKYLVSLDSVDPGATDNLAIRFASKKGNLEIVKYLISIGAYRKGQSKKIDKYVMERQILIILCLNRKLNIIFDKKTYKLFMKSD